jgi:hypothetical protein
LRGFVWRIVRSISLLAFLAGAVAPAAAQYPHAFVVPRGALRVSFEPELLNYDERFGPDGAVEPLGLDLTTDSAGPGFLPTLLGPQLAVQSILGDPTYRVTAGAITTKLDADIRRFPLSMALGLTNRITLTASLPIVTTRMQVNLALDSTDANVGWNQAVLQSGNPGGLDQITQLLAELEAGAAAVEAQIAAGAFGCPSSTMCDQARDLVTNTRVLAGNLVLLTGVGAEAGSGIPPFAPLAGSPAGQAILTVIDAIAADLVAFGAAAPGVALPLPAEQITTDDINTVLTSNGFGYDAFPLAFAKLSNSLGDAEVGLRWGLIQERSVRATLVTKVRLPTGTLDSPVHFTDLGSGDKQTDLIGGLELSLEPGNAVSLAVSASYTLQLSQQLQRRITVPERPIALAAAQTVVRRDLGDVVQFAAYPSVRLNKAFRVYLSGNYFKKFQDEVTMPGGATAPTGFPGAESVDALEQKTEMEMLSLGGGIYFRMTEDKVGRPRLPIEAGIDYRTAFDGKGGLTPNPTRLNFYLRLYYGLWWKRPES